ALQGLDLAAEVLDLGFDIGDLGGEGVAGGAGDLGALLGKVGRELRGDGVGDGGGAGRVGVGDGDAQALGAGGGAGRDVGTQFVGRYRQAEVGDDGVEDGIGGDEALVGGAEALVGLDLAELLLVGLLGLVDQQGGGGGVERGLAGTDPVGGETGNEGGEDEQ